MTLAISQLVALAASAGFSGEDLATAVAIALAESGGNPAAYNPEVLAGAPAGYGSFGLWQIYLKAHPEFNGQNLFDPQTNAAAAYMVYARAGDSFGPWSTFKSGAYQAHLDAVNSVIAPAPADTDTVASVDDGSDPTVSGGDPGSGGIVAIVVVGGIVFWVINRFFGNG